MRFGDREIMTDVLICTRYISANYHRAVLESSNDRVRNLLLQMNNEELNLQQQIYNLMNDRDWYTTYSAADTSWPAETPEIQEAH